MENPNGVELKITKLLDLWAIDELVVGYALV